MQKKLTRSREHRVIEGVMGGLGEYFDVDPVLIRLAYLIITVFTGFVPGFIGYVVAVLIIPEASLITPSEPVQKASDDTEAI